MTDGIRKIPITVERQDYNHHSVIDFVLHTTDHGDITVGITLAEAKTLIHDTTALLLRSVDDA